MTISLDKNELFEKLTTASHFISNKISTSSTLQGVFIENENKALHLYATNLSSFYHTTCKTQSEEKKKAIVEPRKILEFLHFLDAGEVVVQVGDKDMVVMQKKTRGVFPLLPPGDFPLPPVLAEKEEKMKEEFFTKNLPLVLFSASKDEARPVLSGVNFLVADGELCVVSTDGFRLSLLKVGREGVINPMLVPADFLGEVLRFIEGSGEVGVVFSEKEKIVRFSVGGQHFYTRLIEGQFPPFERLMSPEKKTTITLEREEMLKNIKLISVFARDHSNIVVCEFKKGEMLVRPKKDAGIENNAVQDVELEGEEQKVAFNYRFLLEFLNAADGKNITIQILRPDAPVSFRMKGREDFLHIIMPVRIQE